MQSIFNTIIISYSLMSPRGPGKLVRNQCKSRAFNRLYSGLSDEFKQWFSGLGQKEKTTVINDGFEKQGRKLISRVEENYRLQEKVTRTRGKKNAWQGRGVIQEVAETKLGGLDKLRQAVKRGAVKVFVSGGVQMFRIPESLVEISEAADQSVCNSVDTNSHEQIHEQMKRVPLEGPLEAGFEKEHMSPWADIGHRNSLGFAPCPEPSFTMSLK